jgi:uncharacterized membrane protein
MREVLLVLSVFLASFVEGVEALTIVLAVGTTRGWRSTVYGMGAALLALALIVGVLGPALTAIPLNALRLIVGGLLLTFGLQWLRKAILRASGFTPLHDEAAIFSRATRAARQAKMPARKGAVNDWYAFTIAFKGVLLEGLEIAFIVITFGANQGSIPLAAAGAAAAVAVVVVTGVAVHRPLAQVPENTLKFVVGLMLTSFGIFWGSEGAGVHWPGSDLALVGIIAAMAITSVALVGWLRRRYNKLPLAGGSAA